LALLAFALPVPSWAQSSANPEAMAQIPAPNPESALLQSGKLLEGEGVLDRARPEYDAAGVPVGGFTLYPTAAAGFTLDDNIYRAVDPTSDMLWTISPRLDLRSNWQNDALQFYSQLDRYSYENHATESRTDWTVGGTGRVALDQGSLVSGQAYYLDTHESRTSPDLSDLALSPTRFRRAHADATASDQLSDVILSADVSYDRYDYDETKLIGGGLIDNSDRDRNIYDVTGRAAYELAPQQDVFLQFTYENHDYDRLLDRYGIDRNSDGYRLDVGEEMMVTPLIQATAYVGWLHQNYVAPLHDADGIDFNAKIDWFVTELVTAHLVASRTIEDTTIPGASSMDVRRVALSAEYELLRNLILEPSLGYYDADFDGIARNDKVSSAGLEGKFMVNRNFTLYASYAYQQRATNARDHDFSDNLFSLGIRGQL